MDVEIKTPADNLEGHTLISGWKITEKVVKKIGGSGANFGICYVAEKGGQRAFVKAVDFRRAFTQPNFIDAIADLANHAVWEREVMEYCRDHGMSQIVRLIEHEEVLLPGACGDVTQRIFCLIMEIGNGDLRGAINFDDKRPESWKLYVARDVALALDQLHRRGIAHLDVKPSNIISVAREGRARESMKLGDLGRVVRKGVSGPFDTMIWPGDPNYQPPEKLYGYQSVQWNDNRESADAFMLGSLLVFLFTGLAMPTLLYHHVPESHRHQVYRGNFDANLIDVLVRAQSQVLATYVRPALPDLVAGDLISIIKHLTDPDPVRRGDPRARRQGVVGMDRFHQKLLRMAGQLERDERRKAL